MRLFLVFALGLLSFHTFASSRAKIEICKSHIVKNGEKLYLGHSIFEVGDDKTDTKAIFNYESDFGRPITYTFDFATKPDGKLWMNCAYNGEKTTVMEQTEVKFTPKKCIEKMSLESANRVDTFHCER